MAADSASTIASEHRYRPEIDGLRAVAVILVVLYHAKLGVPGGYIGVDVFFVISGFLIGSLIWKDLQADRFSLAQFWERRARRIMPALLVVCAATLAAGWFLLMPFDYQNLGRSAAAQALFTANFYFREHTGYFNASIVEHEPLLHTWSLAVEEQYYFVVPLALLAIYRFRRFRRPGMVLAVSILLILVSLGLSTEGAARQSRSAFYMLHTRIWELLMGGMMVVMPARWFALPRAWREAAAWLGLGLILVPAFLYHDKTPFPGLTALPPCAGAAMIIAANTASITSMGRLLSLRPIVFVGLISYSLYLWHWPVLALTDYRVASPLSLTQRGALVAVSFLLAVASWRWIETPFRRRRWCASRRSIFAVSFTGLACLFIGARLIVGNEGFPNRFPPSVTGYLNAKKDQAFLHDIDTPQVRAGKLQRFGSKSPHAPIELLVWGDSHAMASLPAFDALFKERGIAGLAATRAATAPLLDYVPLELVHLNMRLHNAEVLRFIQSRGVRNVVLVANWSLYPPESIAEFLPLDKALLETVKQLREAGVNTWIILGLPAPAFDVPRALARAIAFDETIPKGASPSDFNGIVGSDPKLLQQLRDMGVTLIDPRPSFLDPTGNHYRILADDVVLFTDSNHLTVKGALKMLLPLLREQLPIGNKKG